MDISVLARAVRSHMAQDAWKPRFTGDDWILLARYLERRVLAPGQVLVGAGEVDRTVHLVEGGSLQVILSQPGVGALSGIAHLMPGSIVGEPGLFAAMPRVAQLEAVTGAVVWSLLPKRLEDLMDHQPALALELLRSGGEVLACRLRANLERGQALP